MFKHLLASLVLSLSTAGITHAQTAAVTHPQPEVFDQKIIDIATKEIGVYKLPKYESQRVKMYVESTDQEADEYYEDGWCEAFVSWVLKQAGYEYASLNSVDQLGYFFHQVSTPKIGDVVTIQGHIAFFGGYANLDGLEGEAIILFGGNQAYRVCKMPLGVSYVMGYWEPIKAPPGWTPSKHISNSSMFGFNRLNDKSYVMDILTKSEVIP